MDQNYQTPDLYQPETPTNPKGKFSFVWGIVGCAVSVVIYIASIALMGAGAALGSSMTPWIILTLVLSLAFLILSIFTLIAGIKGIRINPRTKAIIGTAFSAQNLIIYIITTILCIIGLFASQVPHSSRYDFDDLDDIYEHYNDYSTPDYDDIYDY